MNDEPKTVSVVGPGEGFYIQPAVMLSTFTPDLYVQYFRAMRRYSTEPAT